jgi:IS1 family transposase
VRGLRVRRLQCDEIWSFVGAKKKNVSADKKQEGWGDVWTWTAIDADTKMCVSYLVGGRDAGWAYEFMQDCALRQMEAGISDHVWTIDELVGLAR